MPENTWYRRGPVMNRLPSGCEPQLAQAIGVPEGEMIGVYICDEAADFIGKYVMADTTREMGGILVGYVARSSRPFLLIRGAIEARDAGKVDGGLAFTEQAWAYMQQVWEREYPGTLVVGWFCSHPGHGVSLTGYDRFTHHRLFSRPWQLAFTIDPIENTSLFYRWDDDRLVPVEHFSIWNSRKEPAASLIPIHTYESFHEEAEPLAFAKTPGASQKVPGATKLALTETAAATSDNNAYPKYRGGMTLLPWVALALLLFLFLWPSFPWSIPHLWSNISNHRQELQRLQQQLEQSEENPSADSVNGSDINHSTESREANSEPVSQETGTNSHEPELAVANTKSRASPQDDTAFATTAPSSANSTPHTSQDWYEIQPGDTLWEISRKLKGTPLAYHQLAEANGIEDPALIFPGAKLRLSATSR